MAAQQKQLAFCQQLNRHIGDTGLPNIQAVHQHYIVFDGTASHVLQLLRPPGLQELINACYPVMFPAELLHLPEHALRVDKVLKAEALAIMAIGGQ
jgi:hypothetical protein